MLVEIGVLSIVLAAAPPPRFGEGRSVFSHTSGERLFTIIAQGSSKPNLIYSKTLEDALAMDLGLVPEVRYVCVERADDNLRVWIAVDNPTKQNREKVFQKQFDLIDGFPEISFDFNVIPSLGRTASAFAPDAKMIYSREDE